MKDKNILDSLREKANRLPLTPGVYIMYNELGKVIYVGKSKALKNRVSQYFNESPKDIKTSKMVGDVRSFDFMLTDTEIEALTLENKLIKLYQPKYNILLKDNKNYPYIKVTVNEEYPRVLFTRKRLSDGAKYFGPYSGAGKAMSIIKTTERAFALPQCKLNFPQDIGKSRPCIYAQIGQCCAPCAGKISSGEYKERFSDVLTFLRGSYNDVKKSLTDQMMYASENLMFETAALMRDRIKTLELLWQKQKILTSPDAEYDIVAIYRSESCSCLALYYVRAGAVIDSDNFVFSAEKITDNTEIISFLCEMYSHREYIPSTVVSGIDFDEEQMSVFCDYIKETSGVNVKLKIPQRGELKSLCEMVESNAQLHAVQYLADNEKDNSVLVKLAQMLALEVVPENIESIDISNYGNDNITAGIISLKNAKFNKKGYRTYKIRTTDVQDDYLSMCEALERRVAHQDEQPLPDLFLLDGGKGHVSVVKNLFERLGVYVPVFGMVKDEFHKTRTLTDGENEISIAKEQSVFMLIYKIQEEVHRFTVSTMQKAKSKKLTRSSLENVAGIGQKKAAILLAHFKTLTALKNAAKDEIAEVKGVSAKDAENIRNYFDNK
ncbi:MAG: excinuclease ABC subunit UvrC [Ruminococcaceae bacterium]|nr:excinuclease ABC subunit UvrC [Oscillospiraceae bacterium]